MDGFGAEEKGEHQYGDNYISIRVKRNKEKVDLCWRTIWKKAFCFPFFGLLSVERCQCIPLAKPGCTARIGGEHLAAWGHASFWPQYLRKYPGTPPKNKHLKEHVFVVVASCFWGGLASFRRGAYGTPRLKFPSHLRFVPTLPPFMMPFAFPFLGPAFPGLWPIAYRPSVHVPGSRLVVPTFG